MPDDESTLMLDTDASHSAIGAVLSQNQQELSVLWQLVAYASRKMSKAKCNYSATLKELLAVVSFVKYFVMSCMRVCRKQALSRVKYYYYTTIRKIQQATILTV